MAQECAPADSPSVEHYFETMPPELKEAPKVIAWREAGQAILTAAAQAAAARRAGEEAAK